MNTFDWSKFLESWIVDIRATHEQFRERWASVGLPDPGALKISTPSIESIAGLEAKFPWIDRSVLAFYCASNGWQIWLGSYWCEIRCAEKVNLFSVEYPEAYQTAFCFVEEFAESADCPMSLAELEQSVVLSIPDARDFVLTLPSQKSCVFSFDEIRMFVSFEAFMLCRREAVLKWVSGMLRQ